MAYKHVDAGSLTTWKGKLRAYKYVIGSVWEEKENIPNDLRNNRIGNVTKENFLCNKNHPHAAAAAQKQ